MLKFAIIATQPRSEGHATRCFGPFHDHASAEHAVQFYCANTKIVPVTALPAGAVLHTPPFE